jgi:hypothetical protein
MAAGPKMTGENILPCYRESQLVGIRVAGASIRQREMGDLDQAMRDPFAKLQPRSRHKDVCDVPRER